MVRSSKRPSGLREAREVLSGRSFRWYFIARTVSTLGTSMAGIALTFAVLELTDSAAALSQVLAANMIPLVVFMLIGGVVADRLPRDLVLRASHVLTGATQAVVALLIITETAQLWHLIVLEGLNGLVMAFTFPAMAGIVPQLVPAGQLQQANSLLAFSRSAITILGPTVAALLVTTVGAGWALAVDAATWFVAAGFIAMLHLPARTSSAHSATMWSDLREGWTEFRSREWVWVIVVVFGIGNAIHAGAWGVIGPVVARETPGFGAAGWGIVASVEAVGIVLGTVFMLRHRFERPMLAGMVAACVYGLPILVLGLRPEVLWVAAAGFIAGVAIEIFGIGWMTALGEHVPEHVLSRVSSYDALGSWVAIPIGQLAFGLLATTVHHETLLIVGGAGYVLVIALGLLSRSVRTLGRVDAAAT